MSVSLAFLARMGIHSSSMSDQFPSRLRTPPSSPPLSLHPPVIRAPQSNTIVPDITCHKQNCCYASGKAKKKTKTKNHPRNPRRERERDSSKDSKFKKEARC